MFHFVYSYIAYVAFSFCLRREDQFVVVVFFPRRARGHAVVMVNDPFSDLPFFLVVKNPYDLRSQICFWIPPPKTHSYRKIEGDSVPKVDL